MEPIKILEFESELGSRLPETCAFLKAANLVVHPSVERIVLHGSRGPAGGYRPGSDLDLSLVVDPPIFTCTSEIEKHLYSIFETTQGAWQSDVELDLAIVFDVRHCGLICFNQTRWDENPCTVGGVDCFGLYKVQKGFNGLVFNAGIMVKKMYPCLRIWQR